MNRQIPWKRIVDFHAEITRRSEEAFFSLPMAASASERWTSLGGFDANPLAGPWLLDPGVVVSPAIAKAIESNQTTDMFLGGPWWIAWTRDGPEWVPRLQPVLYREVTAEWLDGGGVRLTPAQGNWDISPLVYKYLDRQQVQLPTPLDELLPGLLEQAQSNADSEDIPCSAAFAQVVGLVASELHDELQKAKHEFPGDRYPRPSDWVLFSAPSQVSATHQYIRRDYGLLQKRLEDDETVVGGMALLEDPPRPPAQLDVPVLPIVPLNDSQHSAVQGILGKCPVTVVSGPPGCGKSQVVLSVLLNAWAQGQTVLFASNNNQAVDVIRERLERFESDFPISVRAGARRFNNVEESLRRTLNVVTGAAGGDAVDRSQIEEDRNRFLKQKDELTTLLESQLPQQVHEASTAALKAYRQFHDRKQELADRYESLVTDLKELGYEVRPENFKEEVLGRLAAWLDALKPVRQRVEADRVKGKQLRADLKEQTRRRNKALNSLGYEVAADSLLSWLADGPGPELIDAWRQSAESVLSDPLEEWLSEFDWSKEYDRWPDAQKAKDWAVQTDRLTKNVTQAAADLLPLLTELRSARQALEHAQDQLPEVLSGELPRVRARDLDEWSGLYAELCSLPDGRMDRLPWSQKRRLERAMKRVEQRLRSGFPLSVWRRIGTMDDAGRMGLAEIVEPVQRWAAAKGYWDSLAAQREELEEQIGSFRAQAAELGLDGIPAENDLDAWTAFSEQSRARVPEALDAARAHDRRAHLDSARVNLRKLARDFRQAANGVPVKECWMSGPGQGFMDAISALESEPSADDLRGFRRALYEDALANLVRHWSDARESHLGEISIRSELDRLPMAIDRLRPWAESGPPVVHSLEFEWEDLLAEDHPFVQHQRQCEAWSKSWEQHTDDAEGPSKEALRQDKSFALDRLKDALELAPDSFRPRVESVVGPILAAGSMEWPLDEISRSLSFFVPEQLRARIEQLDKELEKLSFDQAKQDWTDRVAGDAELQDCLERLITHFRRHKTHIQQDGYEDFQTALDIQPIWITAAMSAHSIPMLPGLFDVLVIDEATQCTLTNMLPLIYRAKRLVVIGDPEQLTAIHDIGIEAEAALASKFEIQEWINLLGHCENDLYKTAVKCLPRRRNDVIPLLEHYRSHPLIIGFSNKHIYHDRLRLQKKTGEAGRVSKGVFGTNVSGQCKRGPRERSWVNPPEAEAVCDLISGFREGSRSLSIGVVTPFRPQKDLITDLLKKRDALRGIIVDTVHRFQGDERDVMVFSPVVARGITEGAAKWVESPPNLINVAVTRARDAFHFVADFEMCRGQQGILGDLTRYVETVEELRNTSDAELKLFTELVTIGLDPAVHVAIGDIEVDFVLEQRGKRLVAEVDGQQHKKTSTQDAGRDAYLIGLGYDVLRVTARQVLETPALVVKEILDRLGEDISDLTGSFLRPDEREKEGERTEATATELVSEEKSPFEVDADSNDFGQEPDWDMFPDEWVAPLQKLIKEGWSVEPGGDVEDDGRVVGSYIARCTQGDRAALVVDRQRREYKAVCDVLTKKGMHYVVADPEEQGS